MTEMAMRRDGDGDDGDGDDGDGDDGETETALETELAMTETAEMAMTLGRDGDVGRKPLQAHFGTYFSQPVQHGAGHETSGLLGTCRGCRNVSSSWA